MSDRELIHDYLSTLGRYLARLDKETADEVIREIESHIYDRLDGQGDENNVSAILDGFGEPRELASAYVDHVIDGTPPPKGFSAIAVVKKGASKSIYYMTGFFGYLLGIAAVVIGILEPFDPDNIGVWSTTHGQSFVIGVFTNQPEGTTEVLGWWLVPIALLAGGGVILFTRRLMAILKRQL